MYNRKFFDLWKKDESSNFIRRLAFFCAMRSGRWSDELCNLVQTNNIEALCNFDIVYTDLDRTQSVRELRYARQCLAFYSKNSDLTICDTEKAMYESFVNSEKQCHITNLVWSSRFHSENLFLSESGLVGAVARKVNEILGSCPEISDLDIGFGPGSSVNVKTNTTSRFKLDAIPTCSRLLSDAMNSDDFKKDIPHYWKAHNYEYTEVCAQLQSVPKNAKTKRSVIVEPTLCTLYQKGYGSYIRKQLKLYGLNLKYGQQRNRELALLGSTDGSIVTVDVKNASNCMAVLPVYHTLNEDWFDALNSIRSDVVIYKKQKIELEMFSSMGNGFTFELETLLFYAIALVVTERANADTSLVSVYGDDIIVPTSCYQSLCSALKLYGFQVNYDKTHTSGFFRESCGVDYYLGKNIRPFYIKDRFTDARLVGLLNFDLRNNNLFYEVRNELIRVVNPNSVTWGPDGFGDGHLITDDFDINYYYSQSQTQKQAFKNGDKRGLYFDTFRKVPNKCDDKCVIGDKLDPLYQIYARPSLRRITCLSHGLVFDVYGLSHVYSERITTEFYVDHDDVKEDYDPFIVRGGYKSQKIPIYMLP